MESLIRAVVDTSVLVASILGPTGASREILSRALDGDFIWVVSEDIVEEYRRVLQEEKIAEKAKIPLKTKQAFEQLFERLKKRVSLKIKIVRDHTDDKFVECAIEHQAGYIVSLDKDLLSLKHFGPVKMLKPSEFLAILRKGEI